MLLGAVGTKLGFSSAEKLSDAIRALGPCRKPMVTIFQKEGIAMGFLRPIRILRGNVVSRNVG
jgi:hypothetical protein